MPFAEFIAENFHSMADFTWDINGAVVAAHFAVEDVRVEVTFELKAEGEWHVAFDLLTLPKSVGYLAFHIFNGVFQAAEEFIAVRQPTALIFATKRDELAHIYATYLRRETEHIEALGYRLSEAIRISPYTEYRLERRKAPDWRP